MDKLITVSHAIHIVQDVAGCFKCEISACPDSCKAMEIICKLSDADADAVLVAVEARLL